MIYILTKFHNDISRILAARGLDVRYTKTHNQKIVISHEVLNWPTFFWAQMKAWKILKVPLVNKYQDIRGLLAGQSHFVKNAQIDLWRPHVHVWKSLLNQKDTLYFGL